MGIEITSPIFQKTIWIIELFLHHSHLVSSQLVLRDQFSPVLVKSVHSKAFRLFWLTFSEKKKSFHQKAPQLEDKKNQKSHCFQGSKLHNIENLLLESSKTCTSSSYNTCYERTTSLRIESRFLGGVHKIQGSLRSLRMFLCYFQQLQHGFLQSMVGIELTVNLGEILQLYNNKTCHKTYLNTRSEWSPLWWHWRIIFIGNHNSNLKWITFFFEKGES